MKTISIIIGLAPFAYGMFHGITKMDSILSTIGVIVLGMAGTLMLFGVFSEKSNDHGSGGVMSFLSILVGILGGLILLGDSMLK